VLLHFVIALSHMRFFEMYFKIGIYRRLYCVYFDGFYVLIVIVKLEGVHE
jgi:hypothetical protein